MARPDRRAAVPSGARCRRALTGIASALILFADAQASGPERRQAPCRTGTGDHDGFFYTMWKSGGDACMTLGRNGRYAGRYRLVEGENVVMGVGWRTGSVERTVGYRARAFDAGSNSYLALYGWSTDPLVEYYVVENWGSDFTPPGPDAAVLGTVASDGGVYRIYRTRRVEQPSIRGIRSFDQYWSVRTTQRPVGARGTITFSRHIAAWRTHGMVLGSLDYQVLATEGFGSTGRSDIVVRRD